MSTYRTPIFNNSKAQKYIQTQILIRTLDLLQIRPATTSRSSRSSAGADQCDGGLSLLSGAVLDACAALADFVEAGRELGGFDAVDDAAEVFFEVLPSQDIGGGVGLGFVLGLLAL